MAFEMLPVNGSGKEAVKRLYEYPGIYKMKINEILSDISRLIREYNMEEVCGRKIEEYAKLGDKITKSEKNILDNATRILRDMPKIEQEIINTACRLDDLLEYGKTLNGVPEECRQVNDAAEKVMLHWRKNGYKLPKSFSALVDSYDSERVKDACTPMSS